MASRSFFGLLKRAFLRGFEDDIFGIAKAAAYSAILTIFPALLVLASVVAAADKTQQFFDQLAYAFGHILPRGTASTAMRYFQNKQQRPVAVLVTTSLATWWTASGVMMSWMEGFRYAYQLPKKWGMVKERAIALGLVILSLVPLAFASAMVALGTQIENWMIFHSAGVSRVFVWMLWASLRWLLGSITSIAVIAVIYHFAVPRTQPWHTVLPGATLATAFWFPATLIFGWYLTHVAEYNLIYGSLGVAIALLVWTFIISLIVLYGAEFNALLFPRALPEPQKEEETASAQ
jgi:membrane protein